MKTQNQNQNETKSEKRIKHSTHKIKLSLRIIRNEWNGITKLKTDLINQ